MKWSLFNWKKPVVSSGEPEDYQVVKNTVSQNERNITNINSQITNVNNQLANTVSTNTTQTISAEKTFSNGIVSSKTGETIQVKPGVNTSGYISFYNGNTRVSYVGKGSSNSDNFIIGTTAKVVFEATQGIEIPAPTANNNPATKNYVDTKNTEATTYTDNKITETRNYIDTQISGINTVNSISYQVILLMDQAANSTKTNFGPFVKDTIEVRTGQNVKILSITSQLDRNLGGEMEFTYSTYYTYHGAWLNFMYEGTTSDNTNWQFSTVTIWYISSTSSRITDPFYIVPKGANNEN